MRAPRVSIIVPSRTGVVDALEAQLAAQTLRDWELVVARGIEPAARARNHGAAEARGRLLVFLDDDIHLGNPELLGGLVEALERAGEWAVVGVQWRPPADATPFQRRYVRDSFRSPVQAHGGALVEDSWQAVGGACMAMARATFGAVRGFDEHVVSGEDYELCYRICRELGGRVYVAAGFWVEHAPPRTLREAIRKAVWYDQGNAQVARKHPRSGYRITLRSRWHAAGYLFARTLCLAPLCFIKISYQHRRPRFAFRPQAALLSYIGAWAYCASWFREEAGGASRSPSAHSQELAGARVGKLERVTVSREHTAHREWPSG